MGGSTSWNTQDLLVQACAWIDLPLLSTYGFGSRIALSLILPTLCGPDFEMWEMTPTYKFSAINW
jgi:hypothetical protein